MSQLYHVCHLGDCQVTAHKVARKHFFCLFLCLSKSEIIKWPLGYLRWSYNLMRLKPGASRICLLVRVLENGRFFSWEGGTTLGGC